MSNSGLQSYFTSYLADRGLEPTPHWRPSGGTFTVVAIGQLNEPLPDLSTRLPNQGDTPLISGDLRLSPMKLPLRDLAAAALGGRRVQSSVLYIHEPYLTRQDNTSLINSLIEISSQLYVKLPCHGISVLELADRISEYLVSWSFLMIRSADAAQNLKEMFENADMIAVGAFAGEGFVIWTASPDN